VPSRRTPTRASDWIQSGFARITIKPTKVENGYATRDTASSFQSSAIMGGADETNRRRSAHIHGDRRPAVRLHGSRPAAAFSAWSRGPAFECPEGCVTRSQEGGGLRQARQACEQ